jgi:hypothetical protein
MKTRPITFIAIAALLSLFFSCGSSGDTIKRNCSDNDTISAEKWTLIQDTAMSIHGPWPRNGYIDEKGDTVVPLDKYFCGSEYFEHYAVVFDPQTLRPIGIDKNGNELFEAVSSGEPGSWVPENEGRIMIRKNGKYGFANHKGEIVIDPIYECANSFKDGKARVSYDCQITDREHGTWSSKSEIYIDKCGNEIKQD